MALLPSLNHPDIPDDVFQKLVSDSKESFKSIEDTFVQFYEIEQMIELETLMAELGIIGKSIKSYRQIEEEIKG